MGQLLIVRKSGNKSKRISLLIYFNLINKSILQVLVKTLLVYLNILFSIVKWFIKKKKILS